MSSEKHIKLLHDQKTQMWNPGPVFRLLLTVTVTKALVLCPLLEDRGCITESIRILVTIDGMEEKCFQITTKQVCRSQQFQLCRQPVPCSQCSNRDGSVTNSSMCPRHDEVATRWSAQCRSTWNIPNRCQKVWDIFRRVSQKRLVNQQAQLVLDPLSNWQPVQLSKSWSHTIMRLKPGFRVWQNDRVSPGSGFQSLVQ